MGISYLASQNVFVLNRTSSAGIALWGGGPGGAELTVVSLKPSVVATYDLTYVAIPIGPNLRRIQLEAKSFGDARIEARLGANGPPWATANITVQGTVVAMGDRVPANDAPFHGSIPIALGIGSVLRIPVPGTKGLCIELSPRGWTPKGGSTSTLFIQDSVGKRNLRLDYGYNVKTKAVDFHWNQKGTFDEFKIADHTPAGPAGEALFKGAKYFKYGGRALLVVGVAIDVYSIVVSSKPLRQATKVAAGWGGAWAGCEAVGAGGAAVGTAIAPGVGTAIGGFLGCAVGGFIGYETASYSAGRIYDWADGTVFTPVEASDTP
jgi:hypothetical protein